MVPQKKLFPSEELEKARKAVGEIEQIIRKYKMKGGVKVQFTFTEFDRASFDASMGSDVDIQILEQTEQENSTSTSLSSEECPPICYIDWENDCYHCIIPNC